MIDLFLLANASRSGGTPLPFSLSLSLSIFYTKKKETRLKGALKMRLDCGSVALLATTKRLKMPESIEVSALLPPVLNLVYGHVQTIKKTAKYIDDVSTSVSFGSNSEPKFISSCFAPLAKANRKRKSGCAFFIGWSI